MNPSPEKQSPAQMPDFIRASPSKTETFQGKIPGQEVISVDSSASRLVNQESKINKLKTFRSTRSFRIKGRSKIMKPTASKSSTPDIKNQGNKGISQASHHSSSESSSFDSNNVHSHTNLGSSSLRTSFKSKKRPSFKCSQVPKLKAVVKPTCSSTLKNSKFPGNVGLKPGKTESDRLDMYKVCSYHHCCLHGHSHDSPNPPRRLPMRRKSLKSKKSIKRKNESNSNIEDSNVDSVKEKHMMSMWHLIRRHLHSGISEESKNKPQHHDENLAGDDSSKLSASESSGLNSADSFGEDMNENQNVKLLAVKIVREAIEKIILPEIPDQSSDNDQESLEKNQSDRKAPKHWSNLKKWIMLQRFMKEMEKVRKINPRKPDPEAENVGLRHQNTEERKRAEEWMLDYALQQAISQLAPTQKTKVEILVKAFETLVVPPQGNQFTFPNLKCNGDEDDGSISGENETSCKAKSDVLQTARVSEQHPDEYHNDGTGRAMLETQNYITMWHMVSQHVLSGIASKVGSELLDGAEETINLEETKSRAIKLVREAVNEILVTQSQDDSVDTNSDQLNRTESDLNLSEKSLKECDLGEQGKVELPKSKKWSKLKNLLILKRSIMALENARKLKLRQPQYLPLLPNLESERVDLRHQMMDERKKAEQWMVDYAVQNIVSKLTPARKRRVAMLVEAFEAVVPLPEI